MYYTKKPIATSAPAGAPADHQAAPNLTAAAGTAAQPGDTAPGSSHPAAQRPPDRAAATAPPPGGAEAAAALPEGAAATEDSFSGTGPPGRIRTWKTK